MGGRANERRFDIRQSSGRGCTPAALARGHCFGNGEGRGRGRLSTTAPVSIGAAERDRAELAELLRRVGTGDRAAFESLYRRTAAKLLGVASRICWERTQAEEAVQETYITIWRRAASFDPERGSAMAWLQTVARNQAVDQLRRQRAPAPFVLDAAAEVADPAPLASATLERQGEEARLLRCMEELTAGDARLIRAGFLEGSSYGELATRTGAPLGTIKSRIRRALIKLRACLE